MPNDICAIWPRVGELDRRRRRSIDVRFIMFYAIVRAEFPHLAHAESKRMADWPSRCPVRAPSASICIGSADRRFLVCPTAARRRAAAFSLPEWRARADRKPFARIAPYAFQRWGSCDPAIAGAHTLLGMFPPSAKRSINCLRLSLCDGTFFANCN